MYKQQYKTEINDKNSLIITKKCRTIESFGGDQIQIIEKANGYEIYVNYS